jgi:phage baseplate assembly protein W
MAIEHVLSDADSIQGLAVKYNVTWQAIAEFNSLEYPYTMTSLEGHRRLYASGYLKVTRELYNSALIFYAGSTFTTERDSQGIQRTYEVAEDTTIPATEQVGYLFVRCINFGSFGNTIPGSITLPGNLNTSLGTSISTLTVTNEEAFVNGTDATVRITGQAVYIPTKSDASGVQIVSNVDNFLALLGGEDLKLAPDGDLTDDGYGDLGSAVGLDNIEQSVNHRLMTRRGSITQHPHYGSRLYEIIGRAQTPYLRNLLELDIYETLLYDDRIEAVNVNQLQVVGTSVFVDLTVTINKQGANFKLQLDLRSA